MSHNLVVLSPQVVRQVMPLKRLQLTPFKIAIPAGARLSTLLKAYKVPARPTLAESCCLIARF